VTLWDNIKAETDRDATETGRIAGMAQVSLQINGYGYILGCADGEEERLVALAADLDRRIEEIKASSGPSGEARMLLMAALLLSDELHELREGNPPPPAKSEPKIGRRLRGLAKRAETIADATEALPLSDPPEEQIRSAEPE
jgi:cell division protein ZapA